MVMHFDEKFWVALSFAIFCVAAYKPFVNLVVKGLGKKAGDIAQMVRSCTELGKQSFTRLEGAEKHYKQAQKHADEEIADAKVKADEIILDAKIKAKAVFDEIEVTNVTKIKNLKDLHLKALEAALIDAVFKKVEASIGNDAEALSVANLAKKIK